MREIDGYVYLVRNLSNGLYKIGCTHDPDKRIAKLKQRHWAQALSLLHLIPSSNMRMGERAFHHHFAGRLVTGEWFALEARDVAVVGRVNSMLNYPAPDNSPSIVTVRLLDGRACLPNQWTGMIDEEKEFAGFRLTCVACRRPADLTVARDYDGYDPRFAPLVVELHCARCSTTETVRLPSRFDDWDEDISAYPHQGRLFANVGRYSCTNDRVAG